MNEQRLALIVRAAALELPAPLAEVHHWLLGEIQSAPASELLRLEAAVWGTETLPWGKERIRQAIRALSLRDVPRVLAQVQQREMTLGVLARRSLKARQVRTLLQLMEEPTTSLPCPAGDGQVRVRIYENREKGRFEVLGRVSSSCASSLSVVIEDLPPLTFARGSGELVGDVRTLGAYVHLVDLMAWTGTLKQAD